MQRYGKWAPTGFDQPGAFLEDDRREWFVAPVSRTRDSGPLDLSNWETALALFAADGRDEADDYEVHRFGHWGPGWFEIVIVKPDSRAFEIAEDIGDRMANYPVLDEEDFCDREHAEFCESWNSWACDDFRKELVAAFGLGERAADLLDSADPDTLREFWSDHANYPYEGESSGVYIPTRRTKDWFDRPTVSGLLRDLRRAAV